MSDHVKVDELGRVGLAADPDALLTVGASAPVVTDAQILALSPWAWWDAADWNGDFIDEYPGAPGGHSIAEGDYVPRWHDRAGTSPVHGSRDWVLGVWGGTDYNLDIRKMRYYNTAGALPRRVLGGPPGSPTGGYLSTYNTDNNPARFYSQLAGGEGFTPDGSSPNFWSWTFVFVVAGIGATTHPCILGAQYASSRGAAQWVVPGEGPGIPGALANAYLEDKTQLIPGRDQLSDAVPYGSGAMHTGMPLRSDFRIHIGMRTPGQVVTIDNRPPYNGPAWAFSYWVDSFGQEASDGAYQGLPDRPIWFHGLAVAGGTVWTPLSLTLTGQFYVEGLIFDHALSAAHFSIVSAYLNRKYAKPNAPAFDLLSISNTPVTSADHVNVTSVGTVGLSTQPATPVTPTAQLQMAQRATPLDFLKVEDGVEAGADYVQADHEGLVGLSATPDGTALLEMKERTVKQDFITLKDTL